MLRAAGFSRAQITHCAIWRRHPKIGWARNLRHGGEQRQKLRSSIEIHRTMRRALTQLAVPLLRSRAAQFATPLPFARQAHVLTMSAARPIAATALHRRSMHITTQDTPNPNSLMFHPGEDVMGQAAPPAVTLCPLIVHGFYSLVAQ
jgi:hypothetical protein